MSVTSVGLTMPSDTFSVAGSPVTSAGTIAVSEITQSANHFYAGPATGAAATPTWRTQGAADLPTSGTWPFAGNMTAKVFEAIVYPDQYSTYSPASAQINAAIADLPDGGTVDCRGYGATTQTIASTVTVGATSGPIVLLFDRATTYNVTITNGSVAFSLQPGSCMIALGEVNSAGVGGGNIFLANGANVSNVIKFVGSSGQGNFSIENISIPSNTNATVSDAVISVENGLQISTIRAVGIGGFANCVGLRIFTGVSSSTGPINIYNMYVEGSSVTGFTNVAVQDVAGGGGAGGINFFGGTFTHPGNASPQSIFYLNGVNGGVNGVNFYGCFLESASSNDVGFYIEDCTGISINDVFFSANTYAGQDCVYITGSNTDTIVVSNLNNFNAWTNSINNNINGDTITASRIPWYSYMYGTRNHAYYDNAAGTTVAITGSGLNALGVVLTGATPSVGAGQVGLGADTATAATAGTRTLPSNPAGFLEINIGGTTYKVPYYNS